jgi:hypothetical protein
MKVQWQVTFCIDWTTRFPLIAEAAESFEPKRYNRDRGWPHGLPLPHHRAYGSVHGGSVG